MKKSRIMRKFISMILMLAIICTVATVFSGCGLFTKKITGTEAAKILLARERLDEELVGQKMNVFSTSSTEEKDGGSFFENLFPFASVTASVVGGPSPMIADLAPGVSVGSSKVVWDTFEDASELKASYVQFIEPIDTAAAETAELIAKIKSDVGVTEKWVDTMLAKYMLIVDENSETIIEYYKPHKSISISTRYTTEDAKCVYEMYSFLDYDDGTSGDIRNKCIPGEYYEYTYRNSGGFNDYFIADKSRGYWMTNRFSFDESFVHCDMAAVKGDMGYGVGVAASANADGSFERPSGNILANIFSPNVDRDLLSITEQDGTYQISVYMTNVESGIDSLSASSGAYYLYSDYGDVGDVYLAREDYGTENNVVINLTNGKKITVGPCTDKIAYSGTTVDYNLFFGAETYTGKLRFDVKAQSEKEAYGLLVKYLASQGVSLRASQAEVNEAYAHCELLHDNFDTMEWYGLQMNSVQNLTSAENMLMEDFDRYYEIYNSVKDNETVFRPSDVRASTRFGALTVTSKGSASYSSNGIISIEGLTARTERSELFEDGVRYSLKLGLARLDENGQYSSANTVSLSVNDGSQAPSELMDETLELTVSGEYSLPLALSEGEYVVVVYYATADGGIRVTEMAPVAFFSADEGKLDTNYSLMDVSVRKVGDNLYVNYEVSLSSTVEADISKASYTYEEIERVLIRGVIADGYPIGEAVVQNDKGESLSEGETYGAGTYRLKYLVNTSAGLVEAYMYTTLK